MAATITVPASYATSRDTTRRRYINGFYNLIRRHSALDFTSPAQFEKMADT